MPTASTPCRNICVLDDITGICTGCGRSLREIEAWPRLDESERRAIMAAIAAVDAATSVRMDTPPAADEQAAS